MERQQAVMLLGLKHDRGIMRRELRLEETRGKCNQVTTAMYLWETKMAEETRGKCNQVTTLKNPTLLTPGNPSG